MALAQAGRFEEAIRWQRELIHQAEEAGEVERLRLLRANLSLYQHGEPCCAPLGQP